MLELTKLELIKLCRKKITMIVTAGCLLGTVIFFLLPYMQFHVWNSDGTMLSGKEAVAYRKEVYEMLSGTMTEERITEDIQDYQSVYSNPENVITERGGKTTLKDDIFYKYFEPRHSYLDLLGNAYSNNESGADNLMNVNLNSGADFYRARAETVIKRIDNNEDLGEAEKEYWKEKALSIKTPFEYGYMLGWYNFGDTAEMLIICILGICIVLSSVFAEEYQTGTASIILSTRFGKNKIIRAKLLSAFLFSTVVFIVNAMIALTISLRLFGSEGGNLPIQIGSTSAPYQLTFQQAALLSIGIDYIVLLGLVSVTLLLSSKMKSSLSVLIVDMLIIIVPIFFSINKATALLPAMATLGTSLFNYYISYNIGGRVINHFVMILIVYIVMSAIALPMATKVFKNHQVG
ncbi:ABC transporter permease subunit [Pseudoramibacter alactolyticus]|uniref:ABC transporter permease subunit n=1 Tax=Pseudoramibacter alactolyticus TaxID=113287 RepID=UPI0028EFDAF6|nr:ABC transporter permease subunit [Pseudoramibacter alactolyticus]